MRIVQNKILGNADSMHYELDWYNNGALFYRSIKFNRKVEFSIEKQKAGSPY